MKRKLSLVVLMIIAALSCKDPEISDPTPSGVADNFFEIDPAALRSSAIVVPFLPKRANNVVYLNEEKFVVQIVLSQVDRTVFAGVLDVRVSSNIEIVRVIANPQYFATNGQMISIPLHSREAASFGVSYTNGSTPNTNPNGVLFNLVCKPLAAGNATIRVGEVHVYRTTGRITPSTNINLEQAFTTEGQTLTIRDDFGG
jgi:hypothetical protein